MAACTGQAPTPDSNLPILLTNMANPAPPKSGTGWGSNVCGGHSWLWDNGIQLTPRYEWMPVLGGEADPRIVGISGWAINSGLSTQDVPFTHIFIPDPGSVPEMG